MGHILLVANGVYADCMSENRPSRSLDKIVIRLPDGMRERLQARSAAEKMSVNAYVVEVLERVLAASESEWRYLASKELARLNDEIEMREEQIHELNARKKAIYRDWAEKTGDLAALDMLDEE